MDNIIFFDGVCNLCNGFVKFIIKQDKQNIFKFTSLQSEYAQRILSSYGFKGEKPTTIIFLHDNRLNFESTAVVMVAAKLHYPWKLFSVFKVIPAFLRDYLYRIIAKYRYNIFGKSSCCMVPDPELKDRFL